MESQKNIAIIGGGPAGLIAAERLAAQGLRVTVYDRMPSVGRKFLMAGHGGLNITNGEPLEELAKRYGAASGFLDSALREFSSDDLRSWCAKLGVETFVGTSGKVFPKEMKASPLLRAWLGRLGALGVNFATRHEWKGWNKNGELLFIDMNGSEKTVQADAVLLALGGASWPRLGSNGNWVSILGERGINVSPLRPANCGFISPWSKVFAEKFAGQPLKPAVFSFKGRSIQGEAVITSQGIQGGPIYALSGALRQEIDKNSEAFLEIDLRPSEPMDKLVQALSSPRGSKSLSTFLQKAGLSSLAIGLMRESFGGKDLPSSPNELAELAKCARIRLTATASLERAISSAGGVCLEELNDHYMLNKMPGVFVAGEMLDWDAPTGGYLLQACFSTGVAAAKGIAGYLV